VTPADRLGGDRAQGVKGRPPGAGAFRSSPPPAAKETQSIYSEHLSFPGGDWPISFPRAWRGRRNRLLPSTNQLAVCGHECMAPWGTHHVHRHPGDGRRPDKNVAAECPRRTSLCPPPWGSGAPEKPSRPWRSRGRLDVPDDRVRRLSRSSFHGCRWNKPWKELPPRRGPGNFASLTGGQPGGREHDQIPGWSSLGGSHWARYKTSLNSVGHHHPWMLSAAFKGDHLEEHSAKALPCA